MGDRLATIDMAEKWGSCCVPLLWAELGPHLTLWPGPRPTSVSGGILIHPTTWQQYTDVTYMPGQRSRSIVTVAQKTEAKN